MLEGRRPREAAAQVALHLLVVDDTHYIVHHIVHYIAHYIVQWSTSTCLLVVDDARTRRPERGDQRLEGVTRCTVVHSKVH